MYAPNIEPDVRIRKISIGFPPIPSNPNTTGSEGIGIMDEIMLITESPIMP
jgi:hypothetical protein